LITAVTPPDCAYRALRAFDVAKMVSRD